MKATHVYCGEQSPFCLCEQYNSHVIVHGELVSAQHLNCKPPY